MGVKQPNGTWRMYINFTDLNRACPKDSYPLPKIDKLVDSIAGHELMSFMDAFSGYHQISLAREDEEKTSFVIDTGLCCYNVMPFKLKNVNATYQRLVNKVFEPSSGRQWRCMWIMITKSVNETDHVRDLEETFKLLRTYLMKLNPKKCTFGVRSERFLGYMIDQQVIEVNPDKIWAILQMQSPTTVKDVKKLTGCVATLSRFMSNLADKCLSFFKVLKRKTPFGWDDEAEKAFQRLKGYLEKLPQMVSPSSKEPLLLYLPMSDYAVSAILVVERNGQQHPLYYAIMC